jgi:hypothetical protein
MAAMLSLLEPRFSFMAAATAAPVAAAIASTFSSRVSSTRSTLFAALPAFAAQEVAAAVCPHQ